MFCANHHVFSRAVVMVVVAVVLAFRTIRCTQRCATSYVRPFSAKEARGIALDILFVCVGGCAIPDETHIGTLLA